MLTINKSSQKQYFDIEQQLQPHHDAVGNIHLIVNNYNFLVLILFVL